MAITGRIRSYRDKQNRTWYRIRLRHDPDPLTGKRAEPYHEERYTNEREARAAMAVLLLKLRNQPVIDPKHRTVKELLKEWLEREVQPSVKPRTLISYESCCGVHLVPALGQLRLSKINSAAILCFRADQLAAGVSTRMVALSVLHLRQALSYAVQAGYLGHNPAIGLKPLRHPHHEMKVWTPGEAKQFLATANEQSYSPLWHLALHTGMRKGELIGLQWDDLDLDRGRLSVRRTLSESGPGREPDDTKTGQSRTIDLDAGTVLLLKEHRLKARNSADPSGYVLQTAAQTPLSPFNIIRAMDLLIERAGIPRIRFHDLRHTACSILLANNVPVHVVSRMLGHASAATTLRIYAHLMPGQGASAAETLGGLLRQA